MSFATSLTNHFLIAMPGLKDPNFSRTVTYVCEHTEHGAMGIVINRPMDIRLGEVLEQLDIEPAVAGVADTQVYLGGPVQTDRGFVIHSGPVEYDSTLAVTQDIRVTTSRDVLEAIANGEGPAHTLIALGYAGWGSGQLEEELSANAWLSGPADADIIFSRSPGERWLAAAQLLGIDLNLLSGDAGHA
ncbi:MAG: YqgE/AlgH family protein [Thiohalocapsa sp.]|jgi:putative transcriptional regulator|uniref:YqgE/AlgH family protein n=1 Tax=Thiohalocapsa sp. TaxID=2497641 RepID=UPI0025F6E019|nr:YqgE/AlgH family protein [Thiohalocapsa sp.]MCG6940942.1 YqgE/AlgH family protein [Thiohalocapsa sp.]